MKNRVPSSTEGLEKKCAYLLVDEQLYLLTGNWSWDLPADSILCSDVFYVTPDIGFLPQIRCLFHPDDRNKLTFYLEKVREGDRLEMEFRVITPAGKIKQVTGTGVFELREDFDFQYRMIHESHVEYIREKEDREEQSVDRLKLAAYQYQERLMDSGIWHTNKLTYETWYSDGVFRIHGLPPQSLNAHFHTFTPFIHPDDLEATSAAMEQAYKNQVPVCLEYRILLNHTEVRYLNHTTRWTYADSGVPVLLGTIEDITARKRTELEWKKTENELSIKEKMLQHAEEMVRMANWSLNLMTRQIDYGEQVYRMFGLRPGGRPFNTNLLMKFVHPDDRKKMQEVNRRILDEHSAPDVDFRIIRADGKMRFLRQKGKLVTSEEKDMFMIGTIIDETEREMGEIKLEKAKAELEVQRLATDFAEEMAGTATWHWDLETGEINWSNGCYTLLGFRNHSAPLSQHILLHALHPEDKKEFNDRIDQMLQGKPESDFSFRLIRGTETRYLHARFRLVQKEEKKVFIATLQDTTAMSRLQNDLSEQLRFAEMLSDVSMDQVIVTDLNNYILHWNQRCEEAFDIKKEKAIGRNVFELFPALQKTDIHSWFQSVLNGQTVQIPGIRSTLRKGYHDLLMQPVSDQEGNIIAVLTVLHDITKEYELKKQLTSRLEFIEKLLESTVDRIIMLDRNMNYQYWNRRAEDYYGVKKEEVLGRNILDVFPSFMDDPTYAEFRSALKGAVVHISAHQNLEYRKGYYETYLIPIKDDRGEVTGILWIVHDLTQEMTLTREQRKAFRILDTMNEACLELDNQGILIFVNRQAENQFHMPREEMLGMHIWEIFPEEKPSPIYEAIQEQALGQKKYCQVDVRSEVLRHPISLSATPTDEGCIVIFHTSEDLLQARRKMEESRKLLEQTTLASPDAITIYDLEKRQPRYLNNCLASWTGWTSGELIEMGVEKRLQLIHPEDRKKILAFNEGMSAAKDDEIRTVEYRLQVKKGLIWLRNRSKVFHRNPEGKVTHILSVLQEITEEKRLQEKLEKIKPDA